MLNVGVECGNCGKYFRMSVEKECMINCKNCNTDLGTIHKDWQYENPCPVCQNTGFFKRKDFNQLIGLIIIGCGAVLAIMISYVFLLIFALIDLILMKFIPDVGVCYRCSTEFRGASGIQFLSGFSHHQAELYQK